MPGKKGYILLTASTKVYNKACKLKSIILTGDGTNATYADIYDGDSTSDPQVARLRVSATDSKKFTWPDGLDLERGLYISFETNLKFVTVEAVPVK